MIWLPPTRVISRSCSTRSRSVCVFRADVADLVEENRAALGNFELAFLAILRAGERALFVSEEFAFQQRLRQSAAVNDDQRMKSSRAGVMNRPRHQFLPGAAFPGDQHRSFRGTNRLNGVEDLVHGAALADQVPRTRDFGDGLAQEDVLLGRVLMRQRVLHQVRDLVRVQRLGHVVIGAVLQRRDRGLDRGIAGHDDHDELRIDFVHAALQFDPVGAAHLDIHQGRIPALFRQPGKRIARVFYRSYLVAFFAEPFAQRVAHAQFVVHDQQFSLCAHFNHLTFIAVCPPPPAASEASGA